MIKKLFIILFILFPVCLFSSTNKEIKESIAPMGLGDGFLWNTDNPTSLDSSDKVRGSNSLEEEILYFKKTLSGDKITHKETFNIPVARRVVITSASQKGSRITLIDRMSGVLKSGSNRIEIDLDAGEYQLQIENQKTDSPTVTVYGYHEVNNIKEQDFFLNSKPGEYLDLSLTGNQQRSFWVKAEKDEPVIFEALGRNINHISIWKDGLWKVKTDFRVVKKEIIKGQPLNFIEFNNSLTEGTYLIKVSGTLDNRWSVEKSKNKNPLYVRTTPITIKQGQATSVLISPFGFDSYMYQRANYFVAAPKTKSTIYLKTSDYSIGYSRYRDNRIAKLDAEDYERQCILEGRYSSNLSNLILEGTPGTVVKLGVFNVTSDDSLDLNGKDGRRRYFINAFIPVAGENSIDITPLLNNNEKEVIKSGFLPLGPGEPIVRLYNLKNGAPYFIHVKKSGTYAIQELGDETNANAIFNIKNLRNLYDYQDLENYVSGDSIKLKEGFYLLNINPQKYGIHNFVFFSKPFTALSTGALLKSAQRHNKSNKAEKLSSFNWSEVILNNNRTSDFQLFFNTRDKKVVNFIELPIDVSNNHLPLVLMPNESVSLPMETVKDSKFIISGKNYKLTDSNGRSISTISSGGIFDVILTNIGTSRELYTIGTEPITSKVINKKPTKKIMDSLPKLVNGSTTYVDFDRGQTLTYLLTVDKSGLYRVETTGRLRTSVSIRTANITSLYSGTENGIGRNGLINTFLKPGQYLIEIKTKGNSKGRAGISIHENELVNANQLGVGDTHRIEVAKNSALKFPISIKELGEYQFSTLLLNSNSKLRLEDKDGWPIYINNSGTSSFWAKLEPDDYTYYSLPKNRSARRVTTINKKTETEKGVIPLNSSVSDLWLESETRVPNSFNFSFKAFHKGYINFSEGFEAWVENIAGEKLFHSDNKRIKYELEPGDYSLKIRTIEVDNKRRYNLEIYTPELAVDNIRKVQVPGEYEVSIGSNSVVDIWSFGDTDLEAYLYSDDKLLEYNNDSPGDWNFFMSKKLNKGMYKLILKGNKRGSSSIFVKERISGAGKNIQLPYKNEIDISDDVVVYNIPVTTGIKPINIIAESSKDIFIYLYKGTEKIAQSVNQLAIPIGGDSYSVQFVQRSNSGTKVNISIEYPELSLLDFNSSRTVVNSKAARLENKNGLNYYLNAEDVLYSSGVDRIMSTLTALSVNTKDNFGYLLSTTSVIGNLESRPVELESGKGQTVDVFTDSVGFKLTNPTNNLTLVKAVSPGSMLGLEIDNKGINWEQSWTSDAKSLVVINPNKKIIGTMWNGNQTKTKASLISKNYSVTKIQSITEGGTYQIEKSEAKVFDLDSKGYSVVLSKGCVASIWQKDKLIKTYYANTDDSSFSLAEGLYSIGVINLTNQKGLINFQVGDSGSFTTVVGLDHDFESYFTEAGTKIFNIAETTGNNLLHLYGDINSIKIFDSRGTYKEILQPDRLISLDIKGGRIEVSYNPGLLRVWEGLEKDRDTTFATAGRSKSSQNLNIKEPVFITFKTTNSGVSSILKDGVLVGSTQGLYPQGRVLNYYFNKGNYQIVSRSIGGGLQSGELIQNRQKPIELTGDYGDSELFLSSGESHIYSFNVVTDSKIGIGVKTNKDYITTKIYDSDFNFLDSGALNFIDLKQGKYFMIVESEDTVRYTPVVYGLNGSVQAVPEDVIKGYR
ncbi:MAG: hypothetical protein OCD02_15405 [Spirochaetaceae bacterium]